MTKNHLLSLTILFPIALISFGSAQTFDPKSTTSKKVPTNLFTTASKDLEVSLWASSPLFYNPTNIDIDKDGRIWVAEGVRYRKHHERRPEGDRIMVLQDRNGDGRAETSHVFVQEEALVAPLGVAVIDNQIVVSQPPDLIVYTDVDRNLKFDSAIDKREVILTGFRGKNHDHSLHSVTVGPDSKWYWNSGNCGAQFTDNEGKTWNIASNYSGNPIGPFKNAVNNTDIAGKPSADGHTYVGGFAVRMNPDGTGINVIGHNYRNSYEQSVTSFGDVFQNDNDDPPACRVSYVMEHANFGFCSNDGKRSWNAEVRPGQNVATAEWRQDDPGIYPAGDVYGGGSPTGNTFYENGALGPDFEGMFLACEPARNVVFGYRPTPEGGGFKLERFDFVTTNADKHFAGSDYLGGSNSVDMDETKTLFRPSDVAVGPDGAIYVSDWFDARVGGHSDLDDSCSGAIYRIAPKGFKSEIPEVNGKSLNGAIQALRSPAVNVREIGRKALRAKGSGALSSLKQQLNDPAEYLAVRAVWVLAQLGEEGREVVKTVLKHEKPLMRIAAFRALRREWDEMSRITSKNLESTDKAVAKKAKQDLSNLELKLLIAIEPMAKDEDPSLRREAALALRSIAFGPCRDSLCKVAKAYTAGDRAMLEALGTACTGKEEQAYPMFVRDLKGGNPMKWSQEMADIAWRLHVPAAIEAHKKRALAPPAELSFEARKQALDALAFTQDPKAADAIVEVAAQESDLKSHATWWLINRSTNHWAEYGLPATLKEKGIYDPEKIVIQDAILPEPPITAYPLMEEMLAMPASAERGKLIAQRCVMCHEVGGNGITYGPTLDGWGKTQTREVIFRSIMNPSADIAHGFKGYELKTKDGKTIHGMLLSSGDPLIIKSMGGLTQMIPASRVASKKRMERSLMMSAGQLGLTAQEVADVVTYLKSN